MSSTGDGVSQNRQDKGRSLSTWVALAALFLLLILLLGESLFGDRVLLSFDSRFWPPFSAKAPADIHSSRADMIHPDLPCWLIPERLVSLQMMNNGIPPLWTPYTLGGMPLLAELAFPVFYPVNLVLHGFLSVEPLKALSIQTFINLAIACLGMFLFLRILNLGTPACFTGAFSLGASAWYLSHLYIPLFLNAAAWIPLIFFAAEGLTLGRRRQRYTLLLAVFTGSSALGGFPQVTMIGLYGALFWILARTFFKAGPVRERLRAMGKPLLFFIAAAGIGMGLSLVQLIPALEFKELSLRDQDFPLSMYKGNVLQPASLLGQFVPGLFGHPLDPDGGGGFYGSTQDFLTFRLFLADYVQNNFMENALYIGVIPFLLVLGTLMTIRKAKTWLLFVLALLALLVAMGTPLLDLCYHLLPGFGVGSPKRILVLYTFAFCALAGIGVEQFFTGVRQRFKTIYAAVLICAGLFGICALTAGFGPLTEYLGQSFISRAEAVGVAAPTAEELESVFGYLKKILWPLTFALLFFGSALLIALPRKKNAVAALLIIVFALIEAGHFAKGVITTQPAEGQYPSTRTTDFLKARQEEHGLFRVMSFKRPELLAANLAAVHGIQNAGGVSGLVLRRYGTYCHALDPELIRMKDPRAVMAIKTPDSLASPMLDLLGVRYIAVGAAADIPILEEKGFPLAFYDEEEGLGLFENPNALPRAIIVTRCSVVSGASGDENNAADEALALVSSPAFKPDQEVVLEAPLPTDFEPAPDPMNRTPELTIEDYQPTEITIRANLFDARGFLALNDTWYPGWEALINGIPAEIYRANYTFRAVPLPEGEHEVVFRYRPMSRTLGMMGTFLSLGVILCWSIVLGWKGPLSRSRSRRSQS